jgi:hypothetical protein
MKRTFFITLAISIIIISKASAQTILKSQINGTNWFSVNENEGFYNSDTIKLIRITKFNSYLDSINETNIKLQYVGYKNITDLSFKTHKQLSVINLYAISWTNSIRVGKWQWSFNDADQKLVLFFNRKIDSSFRVISFSHDTITWTFEDKTNPSVFKLNLIILQLVRLKNN